MRDVFEVSSIFPNRRACRWLKEELDTGVVVRGGAIIAGTCRLFGDVVHDLNCRGCSRYQGW